MLTVLILFSDNNETSIVQTYTFDFFNYAGIHRSVVLYTTPKVYITDIITTTNITGDSGRIFYEVVTDKNKTENEPEVFDLYVTIQIRDREGDVVATAKSPTNDLKGYIEIKDVKPWWPYLMHPNPGYLYTMEVRTISNNRLTRVDTQGQSFNTTIYVILYRYFCRAAILRTSISIG